MCIFAIYSINNPGVIRVTWYNLYKEFEEFEAQTDMKLDKWQIQVMEHEGNCALRCGRQVGKSTVIARKAADISMKYENTVTLMIAASQRQSGLIFNKVLARLLRFNDFVINKHGKYREELDKSARQNKILKKEHDKRWGIFDSMPTKTEIRIKKFENWGKLESDDNWVYFKRDEEYVIYSLPAGKTGAYIRGLTIDFRIADEAAFIPEEVWLATNPMLAVQKKRRGLGWDILLSTPFGKGGFFYECCYDKDYRHWHISSEMCPRIPVDYLKKEKDRLTKAEYAQEYLAEFTDDFNQFFPTQLIKKCMNFLNWDIKNDINPNATYYLGMDPARYGQDEAAFVVNEYFNKKWKIVWCDEKKKVSGKAITSLRDYTVVLDDKFKFKRIFNDDTGVGGGLTDLLQEELGKSKVVGINNASKRLRIGSDERLKGILKEDLYSNALRLMEKGEIEIINNMKLLRSLKSVQFEYTKDRNLRIHGKYTHLAEAFVRACWASQSKGLRLFVY